MIRKLACLSAVIILVLCALAGCGISSKTYNPKNTIGTETSRDAGPIPKPNPDQVVLRLAENQPKDYPTTLGDLEFARLVNERTNGRIRIEVYYGGQLGDEKSVIEQMRFGAIDFARISVSPISEFAKNLNVLQLPYIYRNAEHKWSVLNGPIGDELLKSVESARLVGLTWYESGSRNFYNTKKEIKSVADLKGMKIRVQESKLMGGLVEALGASPTPMAYGQVYGALQTGTIDGAENNWPSYISARHYEVAKYITIDNHTMVPEIVVASPATLGKLSIEDQEIIKRSAKESTELQKKEWEKYSKASENRAISAGCKITYLDGAGVSEFQRTVASLYDELGKNYEDLIKRIQDTK